MFEKLSYVVPSSDGVQVASRKKGFGGESLCRSGLKEVEKEEEAAVSIRVPDIYYLENLTSPLLDVALISRASSFSLSLLHLVISLSPLPLLRECVSSRVLARGRERSG